MTWWNKPGYNKVGKTFGRLTVLKQTSTIGRRRYLCKCECGNLTEVAANNLIGSKVISCGCALKGINLRRPYEWLYTSLIRSAEERELAIDISYEDFVRFTTVTNCHYCKDCVRWNPHSFMDAEGHRPRSYNLDRMDSNLGYLKHNVVVCCTRCNRAKNNLFTYEEWVKIGRVIASFGETNY